MSIEHLLSLAVLEKIELCLRRAKAQGDPRWTAETYLICEALAEQIALMIKSNRGNQ